MRFVSNWKLGALLAIACAGTLQLSACTDREVAAGVAGGVIGAIIVDSSRPSYAPPRQTCVERESRRCWPVTDYWGRVVGEQCRTEERVRCGRRYNMGMASQNELNTGDVAETYKLTLPAAEKLVGALTAAKSAQDDDSAKAALESICLKVDELKSIGTSGALSNATVDCLAKTLNQDPAQTAMMVNSITEVARAQQAARTQNN